MPKLTLEVQESDKPILFIVGEKNPLIPYIISEFTDSLKIAQISSLTPNPPLGGGQPQTPNLYHVEPANAALIKNLNEKLEYAIVFLIALIAAL